MDAITLSLVLEYLYRKFVVTFILCLIGGVIRETANTVNMNIIHMKKMFYSVIVSSAIICALMDYINLPFAAYVIICIICGLWSESIYDIVTNSKLMLIILKKAAKGTKSAMAQGVADVLSDFEDDTENKNNDNTKNE